MKRREFKKLTKQYIKDALALFDNLENGTESQISPTATAAAPAPSVAEKEEEEEQEEKPQQKKQKIVSTDWTCAGHVWEAPPTPCQGGEKSALKAGILHNGNRITVCKECFNARERKKNQEKRDAKKAAAAIGKI